MYMYMYLVYNALKSDKIISYFNYIIDRRTKNARYTSIDQQRKHLYRRILSKMFFRKDSFTVIAEKR